MIKRYFSTFDSEGWSMFYAGCTTAIVTCLLIYRLFDLHPIIAGLLLFVGSEIGAKFMTKATVGSIYRHKDGKNQDLYGANKEYMDKRFEAVLGVGPKDYEEGK